MTSPLQRTMKMMREQGYMAEKVEFWNCFSKTRHDLFGIIDVLAVKDETTLGIQVTSYANVNARKKKAEESETLWIWLTGGVRRFVIHGWRKPAGKRRTWSVREIEIEPSSSRG